MDGVLHDRAEQTRRSRPERPGAIVHESDDGAGPALYDQVRHPGPVELGDLGRAYGALIAVGAVEKRGVGSRGGVVVEGDIHVHTGRRQVDIGIDLEVAGELGFRTERLAAVAGRGVRPCAQRGQKHGRHAERFHV